MILASRSEVFVDALLGHPGVDESVALQVQKLASVSFGHPRIADQHSPAPPVRIGSGASCNLAKIFVTVFLVEITAREGVCCFSFSLVESPGDLTGLFR